ncbi:structural maintenance of chromosomes protein 6 [Bombus pyrosoma]|uniref:structural maintenance of chromosomes protein 6 n=1 Tax=Bombus pyrosoma TaxID=396416 RepID=UPI001CB8E6AA|nr:structural maintenance of chromosomes protein 6 [Bombus pyrosoma]XP_043593730.1 structural maintenance of chromosomes protein 6 [Bombus pyrosoma]XP_043593731.1 structural maintenance of chromosomes protein 6 [Bombus pyrosoma]XP_043593732.1 structural maintenance of chromosomes protein 6 [Bombus pyrosoma]
MESDTNNGRKRKSAESNEYRSKLSKAKKNASQFAEESKAGKIKRILIRNFMCHDALEVTLNPNVNFIIGRNGSGKSAILTALTVGLGARANITSRGASVKNFIKKGKNSATIEVSLFNNGSMAYKPDIYGDSITVFRSIGTTSSYKIKNWKGEVVSTRQNELANILQAMNIQIDNPISILNQDISRTFLVSSKPEEKYELFMKATLLNVIGNNYREAELTCEQEYEKLKQYNKILADVRKEVEELKKNIERAEEIDKFRDEVVDLEKELVWAVAIAEERKLGKFEHVLKKCEDNFKQLQDTGSSANSKDEEINKRIQELEEEIESAEKEVNNNCETYNKARQEYSIKKNEHSTKIREWRSVQSKVKRLEDDISTLRKEIHRLESADNAEQSERNQIKQQLSDLEQKLDETEALLRTKQTYQMHLETDKMRLLKEIQTSRIEINSCEKRIEKIRLDINARKKYSDNTLTVFGRNIPRLLRRIEEEYSNGHFKEKPRGPLGAYIKMKDSAWAPAVEHFLGASTFSTFCVDNSRDAKVLNTIMKEIYLNERTPQIICSKFYNTVHDVHAHCTKSSHYSNLLDAMDISDPVVANCLIDQREVECILLIPSSKEAAEIMSKASKVPQNCKRAFTQRGDTFYPDPQYRSYGGPRSLKARFLQVSITDTINALEEEVRIIGNEKDNAVALYKTISEKEKRISTELGGVRTEVTKLHAIRNQYKASINDLKDKIEANETISVTVFKNELSELEQKLHQGKFEESNLNASILQLQKAVESLEEEVKHHRELRQNLNSKINPLKENIKELQDEKEALHAQTRHATKKLQVAHQALQQATVEFEQQRRCTEKAVTDATNRCDRIDTIRSINELERLSKDVKHKILEIERMFGTIEELRKELKEKEAKCGKDIHLISKIEKNYQDHIKRLESRKKLFTDMKHTYGKKIQTSFSNILALRNKNGTVNIDHARKILELEVHSSNDNNKSINDAKSLSGGERSYSTVAFILALWECTDLPFYFLDEFDVFMDKVNRRIIMDILLDHTKMHPQSQFTFLTPLDTSNVLAEDYVTIHKLAPPERGS